MSDETYAYHVFLSYSRKDEPVAEALQHALSKLMRRPLQRRSLRIFRDKTGLQAGGGLQQRLQSALDASEWLVILLSRDANASPWVDAEIQHWFTSRQDAADHLLIVRCDHDVELRWNSDGTPANAGAMPPALGAHLRSEPLYVDLADRMPGWEAGAAVQVAAGVLRRDPEDIASEDLRQHRRSRRLAIVAVAALALLAVGATAAGLVARSNAARAERSAAEARSARAAAEESEAEAIRQEQRAVDVALLAESGRREATAPEQSLGLALESFGRSGSPDALVTAKRVLASLPYGSRFSQVATGATDAVLSSGSEAIAIRYEDRIDVVAVPSMEVVQSLPLNAEGFVGFEFLGDGSLAVTTASEVRILRRDAAEPTSIRTPLDPNANLLAIRRGSGPRDLDVLWQVGDDDQVDGLDLFVDRWLFDDASAAVTTERISDLGAMAPMETGTISPLGNFAAVGAGSRWSFADVAVRVFSIASNTAIDAPIGFRPWTVTLDDRSCGTGVTACTRVEVTVTGEPYQQERTGVVWIDTLDEGSWWGASEFSLPSPLQVTAKCSETLLSGISGASVVSGFGSIYPAILGTDPPAAALCTESDEWIIVERDGTVVHSPRLRKPQTTATGIDTGSWFVTEFSETADLFEVWPDDPSGVSLRPESDGSLSVVANGAVVAVAPPPIGWTVEAELRVVQAAPEFDQGISAPGLDLGVAMSGFDWSRVIDIRDPAAAPDDEAIWRGTFPDAPQELLLMDDGSLLGLFTFRGDYLVLRRIAYSDEFVVDLACQIGAVVPSDVSAALGLSTQGVPAGC